MSTFTSVAMPLAQRMKSRRGFRPTARLAPLVYGVRFTKQPLPWRIARQLTES